MVDSNLTCTRLGARFRGNGQCRFLVWAPFAETVDVHVLPPGGGLFPLQRSASGYHFSTIEGIKPGDRYFFRLNGKTERPDPASRFQPEGVHGPSEIIPPDFPWTDRNWSGIPLDQYILYELHVGTFTRGGTFDDVTKHLIALKELGITAVELMPVAQFPGNRNWGYDPAFPYAVQNSYGGPEALKRLVDICHLNGLAVVLDVVYNHPGPEGNYFRNFGPYLTDAYTTPWGAAINFDSADNEHVRRFFIENALYWITDFHVDALRLDAVHAIKDSSAFPFLRQLSEKIRKMSNRLNRRIYLFAESDLNDTKIITPSPEGGYGLDAQWNEDFHHSLHRVLTDETTGYYQDFRGVQHIAKAVRDGFVYTGQYSSYRRRRHGFSSGNIPAGRLVVFSQNHDQVGNRMRGERLSKLVSFEALKLAAAMVILSPSIPLLFMGEEYAEDAPFFYFTSHEDPDLVEAVRKGRRAEFSAFQEETPPPDPQDESTFHRCELNRNPRANGRHQVLHDYYRDLFTIRKNAPVLTRPGSMHASVLADDRQNLLIIHRIDGLDESLMLCHFGKHPMAIDIRVPTGPWIKRLDSADTNWMGPGSHIPGHLDADAQTASFTMTPFSAGLFLKKEIDITGRADQAAP